MTLQHEVFKNTTLEVAYVGNKGTHVFAGDLPTIDLNQATLVGYGAGPGTPGFVPRDERRLLYRRFGWTQDIEYFCNCADNRYDSLQARMTGRFSRVWLLASYALQRIRQDGSEQFFFDRALSQGPPDWSRVHSASLAATVQLPFGWQLGSIATVQSGLPLDVFYPGGAERDTGPNRPDVIGDPRGPRTREQWFNATPIEAPGSAFARPAVGTFGNLKRNARRLAGVALLVLAARLLDLFWLVTPAFSPAEFSLHWMDLAAVFGVGGLWLSFFVWQLRGQPLLPLRDPELAVEVAS